MTKRIEALPPDVDLIAIREEWLRIGLSTEPADRETAEAGVEQAYLSAGLEPPGAVIWLRSPLEGAAAAAMLAGSRGQVLDQVLDQVRGEVRSEVADQVLDQVRGEVGGEVLGEVRSEVRSEVADQVLDQVRGEVGGEVVIQVWRAVYGQHDADWLGFYSAFSFLSVTERVQGLQAIARSAGWWWPFRGVAVLTERPNTLNRDDQGRLHCEDGPAILYPDGWGVWAWHGTRIPKKAIEQDGWLTVERIREQENAEVRRALRELYGEARYLSESGFDLLDADFEGTQSGAAPRALIKDSEGRRFLVGNDGSKATYYMDVAEGVQTCREAHENRCGFDESRIVHKS